MVPFHIWLPEAHVEAPTAGSVILAGILLKLGTYGFLRFSLPLFPEASLYFTPLIYTMSVVAIVYTSLTTLRQIDLKKIIAYSSVAHMGFVTIGLFTGNLQGVEGAILIMLSHGFVSSALFLCVGVLYDRHHTRILKYYSGLAQTMPLFAVVFVFFTLANLGFPGTSSFAGELLTLVGMVQSSVSVTVFASTGMVLGAAYSIWLCNRLLFGGSTPRKLAEIWATTDLTKRELAVFAPLIFLTLWMGIFPSTFLAPMHMAVANLVYGL
jgi:NADH-quinone oxidoreductase subunit M